MARLRAGNAAAHRRQPDRSARRHPRRRQAGARLCRARAHPARAKATSRARSAATSTPTRSSTPAARCAPTSVKSLARLWSRHTRAWRCPAPIRRTLTSAGRRALRNVALDLMAATGAPEAVARAARQYDTADNMTDRMAALTTLSLNAAPERERALADFYTRYAADALVIDKWFSLQALIPQPDTLDQVHALTAPPGLFLRQSQPRARADRRVRRQPDPVQPRRRRRLRLCRRQCARRSTAKTRNWRRALPPPSAPGARSSRAAAARRKPRSSVSRPPPNLSRDLADIVERALG